MKKHVVCVAILAYVAVPLHAQARIPVVLKTMAARNMPLKRQGGLDDKTKKILAQFASIVMGFFGILQDPNNAANVTTQITGMVNHAVNIVAESVKKGYLSLDATEEEITAFASMLKKRMILL